MDWSGLGSNDFNDFPKLFFQKIFLQKINNKKLNPNFDLYVPPTKVKHYQRAEFTDTDKIIFNDFFKQDVKIFNHFNKTFWQKVENYGNGSKKYIPSQTN